jgi:hypothetical protein
MKRLTITLLALVCAVSAGCAAAREAEKAAANAPTADVAGTWSGSAGTGGAFVPITMTLAQKGTDVSGNISVGGRPDLSGAVTGTVQGQLLNLTLPTMRFGELVAKQGTITGEPFGGLPMTLRRSQ